MNKKLATYVIEEAVKHGVKEFCICPSARNAPFVDILSQSHYKCYYWFEERSASFFALGRSRKIENPVAICVTSGTAVGQLLPAVMEAYYTGIPLVLLTADRPRRFRDKGAPQSCEQVGIFGKYAPYAVDLASDEKCDLAHWNKKAPVHINVCFEEPLL